MGKLSLLPKYVRTLRYLSSQQIFARLGYKVRETYYRTWLYPLLEEDVPTPNKLLAHPPRLWKGNSETGKNIANNTFDFVGRTISMGETIRWYPKEASALWVYNLHYFNWLNDLRTLDDEGRREAFRMCEEWLLNCDHFNKVSWHPYPLSLRIINWLTHYEWITENAKTSFKELYLGSLARQIHHLERNIEWDVGGNHLIKNLKALIYAGLCVPNMQSSYLEAVDLLLEQINIQILEDGMHYERSPHYHVDVLTDLLDIQAMIRKSGDIPPSILEDAIDRMAGALEFLIYPDGGLGLFNDGDEGNRHHIQALIQKCGAVHHHPTTELPDAGYIRIKRSKTFIMMDVGKVCPDELPAHAHADTLSFEMSLGEERVFVNQGTYAYQSKERNTFRGTAAHNTICIDGQDSAEVWASFRVGRRPQQVTHTIKKEENVGVGIDASHDGYRHLGVEVNRKIFISNDGKDIRGEDIAHSKKPHRMAIHFHLAPETTYKLLSHEEAEITTPQGQKLTFKVKGARLHDASSWYAPRFGQKILTKQLVLRGIWRHNTCHINWALKIS